MAFLKRVTGDPAGQIIELKGELTVIGRSPECHIVLDPNGVSRRHAEIRQVGGAHFLADLNSRNLTKVNNTKVNPGKDHPLQAGDRINICDVEFIYFAAHPKDSPARTSGDEIVVTDGGDVSDDPNMHTLDASRSTRHGQRRAARGQAPRDPGDRAQPVARAEDRDARPQDPRLADGPVPAGRAALPDPPGPDDQAPGAQGVQVPPQPPRPVRRGVPRGRGAHQHQPVDRRLRPRAEEGGPEPGRRQRQEPADQRLDRRPEDPLGDVRPAPDPRRPGGGHHPARHERPQAVPPGGPRRPGGGRRARRRSRSRTRRCTRRSSSASGWSAT